MKKYLIIAALLLFSLTVSAEDKMEIIIDKYSIKVPAGWLAEYKGAASANLFFLYSPMEKDDTFQENINLTVEKLPKPYDFNAYYDAAVETLKSAFTEFKVLEKKENYHIYTAKIDATEVKQLQCIYINKLEAYVITCTSNPKDFEKFKNIFFEVTKSFKFKAN